MKKLKEKTRLDAKQEKIIKKVVVPDTSIIVQGIISKELKNNNIKFERIIIHEAVMAELESQANKGRESGFLGLDEIKRIREASMKKGFNIKFLGNRPGDFEIKFAKSGEIDSLIRDLAEKHDATLLTADLVQGKVSLAKGLSVKIYEVHVKEKGRLLIEDFFVKNAMSVRLKEGCFPIMKIGKPGRWSFKEKKKKITKEEVDVISREIIEHAKSDDNSFFESDKKKSAVLKIKDMKILIMRPPVSDAFEITALRPIKKLKLEEYKLKSSLKKHLLNKSKGIIVAGPSGGGKSTFVQALANNYSLLKKTIRTIETTRNLTLDNSVTRHGASQSFVSEIKVALLLAKPDIVFFDEVRSQEDLKFLSDLKFSGINVLGVMQASDSMSLIQRLMSGLGTGLVQSVSDTLIFVVGGEIKKVLCLSQKIKTPTSMNKETARPIILFKDFFTNKEEYEAYRFEGEIVVGSIK